MEAININDICEEISPEYTFNTFFYDKNPEDENFEKQKKYSFKNAYQMALNMVIDIRAGKVIMPWILCGPGGTGKSHLLKSINNELKIHMKCIYINVHKLCDIAERTMPLTSSDNYDSLLDAMLTQFGDGVLLLDNLDAIRGYYRASVMLAKILQIRLRNQKPSIMASTRGLYEINQFNKERTKDTFSFFNEILMQIKITNIEFTRRDIFAFFKGEVEKNKQLNRKIYNDALLEKAAMHFGAIHKSTYSAKTIVDAWAIVNNALSRGRVYGIPEEYSYSIEEPMDKEYVASTIDVVSLQGTSFKKAICVESKRSSPLSEEVEDLRSEYFTEAENNILTKIFINKPLDSFNEQMKKILKELYSILSKESLLPNEFEENLRNEAIYFLKRHRKMMNAKITDSQIGDFVGISEGKRVHDIRKQVHECFKNAHKCKAYTNIVDFLPTSDELEKEKIKKGEKEKRKNEEMCRFMRSHAKLSPMG